MKNICSDTSKYMLYILQYNIKYFNTPKLIILQATVGYIQH